MSEIKLKCWENSEYSVDITPLNIIPELMVLFLDFYK